MTDQKHYNSAGTHVLVYNPATDARWECGEDYLPIALKRGWELAEPVPDEDEYADDSPAGFDPSQHKADEVNAYLAENADDADEVVRVLALEREGKDRKSVVAPELNPGD